MPLCTSAYAQVRPLPDCLYLPTYPLSPSLSPLASSKARPPPPHLNSPRISSHRPSRLPTCSLSALPFRPSPSELPPSIVLPLLSPLPSLHCIGHSFSSHPLLLPSHSSLHAAFPCSPDPPPPPRQHPLPHPMATGCRVYATASTSAKKKLLLGLGVSDVFNSREVDSYVRGVSEVGGVDVVLNSLAGDHIPASIGLLRPFGRFVEIGKRDAYEVTFAALSKVFVWEGGGRWRVWRA